MSFFHVQFAPRAAITVLPLTGPTVTGHCPAEVEALLKRVPRVRIYPHQQLLILHGPQNERSGPVRYLELDQIIGQNCVVTVHGMIIPAVSLETASRKTARLPARRRGFPQRRRVTITGQTGRP
jgi:hypothetical protein